jgi:hypothetical protein
MADETKPRSAEDDRSGPYGVRIDSKEVKPVPQSVLNGTLFFHAIEFRVQKDFPMTVSNFSEDVAASALTRNTREDESRANISHILPH